ncbi:MAG: DNA methyltransferase [Lentisphaeria bacterium]|nr:DNA methyltransferase [Lentisphaeria bacterium]
MDAAGIKQFIERWETSGAAERANYQLFLSELCAVIDTPRPDPATPDNSRNAYVFERSVEFQDGQGGKTTRFIDLYKRGCFVLEAKQGADTPADAAEPLSTVEKQLQAALKKGTAKRGTRAWDQAMLRAKGQADQYVRALPEAEGRPPFIIVVDVGHTIELYSEFSCTGGTYVPFPAPGGHRIFLRDLENEEARERLKKVWSAPVDLDPSRRSARVTREIADRLAKLAMSLEADGHDPRATSTFLMRCLFTMFAEDVWLLPKGAFTRLLESLREVPEHFGPMVEELWSKMNTGGFSTSLRQPVLQFNGGLFAECAALPLTRDQLLLLIEAAQCDWRDVEPAIFGTLLERALNPRERHKLGAHYTPRAYVERLVVPTLVDPLRSEWESVQAAVVSLIALDKRKQAINEIHAFHRRLCEIRVLDPACGSGNFLYVTLEHLKRIEGEVFDMLDGLGESQGVLDMLGHTVDPRQLLGIELNPRAAAIAELVLWIGTLQWHYRNRGAVQPPQPIIRNFHNIECRDALIEWDTAEPAIDGGGQPVTRWDGLTTRPHPVTGREVPDEAARVPVLNYLNPRRAAWPKADFIIGNPPFIGASHMREALGDGYTEAVREAHPDMPESSDFVMYWWNHAAEHVRAESARRFGFVTTNSLRQKFNRRTIEKHLEGEESGALPPNPRPARAGTPHQGVAESADGVPPAHPATRGPSPAASHNSPHTPTPIPTFPLSLAFAIPDHPWVDAGDGAAVRIAMTVGVPGPAPGVLATVAKENTTDGDHYDVELTTRRGAINADLTIGADIAGAAPLKANENLSNRGVCLFGSGFIVTWDESTQLGLGRVPGLENHIRHYRNGRDIAATPRGVMVIDLFGLTAEQARDRFPEVYQWVAERVKPERDQNRDRQIRNNWWLFGRPRPEWREHVVGLSRYIATVETSKHRFFIFLDKDILPDNKLVNIASDDAFTLGVLSSKHHVLWAVKSGSRLGVGNDPVYVKTTCFEAFPFPDPTPEQRARIAGIAERLDAHRKQRQALHPKLKLTDMYNVLEKLRLMASSLTKQDRVASRKTGWSASVPDASVSPAGTSQVDDADVFGTKTLQGESANQDEGFRLRSEASAGQAGESGRPGAGSGVRNPSALTAKEKKIHEQGLVTVLKNLHDELDTAVAAAYGWPVDLADDEILTRLVQLNAERAEEETQGVIRWLRPDYQKAKAGIQEQSLGLDLSEPAKSAAAAAAAEKRPWPTSTSERVQAVRAVLADSAAALTAKQVAGRFTRAKVTDVADLLSTLAVLGHARELEGERYG